MSKAKVSGTHTKVLFQMGEGYAAIHRGGGLPVVGDGGSQMTHSAGSVTTQRIALKYVMASEPGHGRIAIH